MEGKELLSLYADTCRRAITIFFSLATEAWTGLNGMRMHAILALDYLATLLSGLSTLFPAESPVIPLAQDNGQLDWGRQRERTLCAPRAVSGSRFQKITSRAADQPETVFRLQQI